MVTSFKRLVACAATLCAPSPAKGHHQPTPPLETPGHSWASLGQTLVGSLLLSPGSWCVQVSIYTLQESISQSWVSSGSSMVGLMVTSSKRAYAIPKSASPRAPDPVSAHCWLIPPQEMLWKMMLWKCCTQYASKVRKLSSGHKTGKVSFHSNQKKGNAKECWNYRTIALISHTSKIMLKILRASLQRYVNLELPDVQAGFRKGRWARDQIANIYWIIEKAREFQKNIYFCFIDYAKAFVCVDHDKLWKILKKMGILDHLTCLLRNLYAGQEVTVRIGYGTTDWFQIGKEVCQSCILSPYLFNLYAEYIMRNPGLDEAQAGIKNAGRTINNLRYADNTTLMVESEED